jgi:signal transduction histidine kinase
MCAPICNLAFACRACLRQDDELVLEVRDDGRGFDPTEPFTGHLGLRSIQERTAGLGGTCSLASAPSQGLTRDMSLCAPPHLRRT